MPGGGLRDICSPQRLRGLAGAASYERGEEYAREGRVKRLSVGEDAATATVTGTAPYRVALRLDPAGGLQGSCSCPVGETGAFCKHCVALGLAVTGRDDAGHDELRAYLAARPHDELVELVLGAIGRDPVLRDGVRLDMAAHTGDAIQALAAAIDDAAFVADFVRWDDAWAHAERLDAVLDALERRLEDGHADEVVGLVERFLTAVEAELGQVDASSGAVGSTLARAEAVHLRACRQAAPDPVALAERLFALETSTDLLDDALATYADVLGEAGRTRYAELADAAWAELAGPPSWTLARIMEEVAAGDVDRLVAIKARTLEHGWDYLGIAELLRDAGRVEEAIGWAERGTEAHTDARLREFIADCHRAGGRPEMALWQRAAQFGEQPTLAAYKALRAEVEPLGRWSEQRAAALARLERPPRGTWPRDRSVLVAVLLWEGDTVRAWEEAHAGGCSRELWRALARERAAERPGDAVDVYRRLLAATIDLRNDSGYDGAIELLDELHALLARHGHEGAHAGLVTEVREVHRRKRNLIKRLDDWQWVAPCP